MQRLLIPAVQPEGMQVPSKRLNLRDRVARIEWSITGSDFESLLVLYHATVALFGFAEARKRMRLHTPYFVRLAIENAYPRVYVTNRLMKKGLPLTYGPFPSRLAAERYCEGVLDLFKMRRCYEDLDVSPTHPGCAYGEMKKCMAPCNQSCTPEEYAAEAASVKAFFDTHGESLLSAIATDRERAAGEMEFERAAAIHEQWQRVHNVTGSADELVRPLPQLRAAIVQRAAGGTNTADAPEAALFLLQGGCLGGPERLSTLGVRAVKEQTSVGSSLFAQPLMLQAVPLGGEPLTPAESPEERAHAVLGRLEGTTTAPSDLALLSDHLSLLRRWYYRPEKQRAGEVFLPNPDGSWPVRRILRGAARISLGDPKSIADTDREGAKAVKTRILHEGRPDVQREVPIISSFPDLPTFTTRRRKKES